jgi:diaminohydroxyphosphoribosylaminopyrimidine deaminase/5-amino-6-(5-phosphoribosylamino)uracil reductase
MSAQGAKIKSSPASASASKASASARRDEEMMRLALRVAARGDGRTHPNPSVGAIIFRGDRILGRGTTRSQPAGAHAEIVAMTAVRRKFGVSALRGASMAVTLEPCNFVGRTGACTEAILEAGISRVVVGCRDPHPKVNGRGIQKLRRRGVKVTSGVLKEECRRQHRGFLSVIEVGRPHVTLKMATTLDGRIALANGESRWITSEASRKFVHRLRDRSDAVMVGSETARVDDPRLDVRRAGQNLHQPIRILLDGRLRVPTSARIYEGLGDAQTWVICREGARGIRRTRLAATRVFELPPLADGFVDLPAAFRCLAEAGLTTLLVEGGGRLAAALLRADLVDEVHWMLAPKLIGGDGRSALGPLGLARLVDGFSIDPIQITRRGGDLHLHGLLRRGKD